VWAATALKIPAEVLVDLSEEAINRLRILPLGLQERLSQLNVPGMHRALGCASPCLVNLKDVVAYLTNLAADGARAGEKALTTARDVIDALHLPPWANTSKLSVDLDRLGVTDVIRAAHLTDRDFAKLQDFIPLIRRSMSTDDTYYMVIAYLDALIPGKLGPDVVRLRQFGTDLIQEARQ